MNIIINYVKPCWFGMTEIIAKLKIYRKVRDKIDFFSTNDLNKYLGEGNE